ncbi:hypothetical protein HKX48_008912 [Thoreauomyces humboldtii]|nr:hypothetical protein HKX48_008912 [Thoreauomyces humboldtii]
MDSDSLRQRSDATLDSERDRSYSNDNLGATTRPTPAATSTTTGVISHPHTKPADDPLKHDPEYVAYEKAGIEGRHDDEYDVEDDAIARAINSVVPMTDDPTEPVATFRVLFLGTLWGIGLCFANAIMAFRTAPAIMSATIVLILAYPMGKFMARVLPSHSFTSFGRSWSLNPGPFTMKEHVIIVLMASAAGSTGNGVPYGTDNVIGQKLIAGQDVSFAASTFWTLATQLAGFGMAGIVRRFIIWPREMVWPGNFAQLAVFASYWKEDNALAAEGASKYKLSRYTAFWIVSIAFFAYEWLPLYIFPALQTISLLCWFSPNKVVKAFGSASTGMGYLTISLDWTYFSSTWLTTPLWVTLTLLAGNLFWYWILTPIMYAAKTPGYQNIDPNSGAYAMQSSALYNATGHSINKKDLYFLANFTVNEEFVAREGPFTITHYFLNNYLISFFNATATLAHIALWYGPQIRRQFNEMRKGLGRGDKDIHNHFMRAYPEVPEWFYAAIFVVFVVVMIVVGEKTVFTIPWWATLLSIAIAAIFLIPIGIVQAITGQQIGLNVITEFVAGLLMPGKIVAVMCFKSWGYNSMSQALSLLGDLKMGHYLHISPVVMFATQFYGTALGAIASNGFVFWIIESWGPNGSGKLDPASPSWGYANFSLFFNAAAIWGAIGPKAFFADAYHNLPYLALLFGAIMPFLPWLANRAYPHRFWPLMNFAVFSTSVAIWGVGYRSAYFWGTLFIALFFQGYLYRRHFPLWSKYNYVFGAGADFGLAICTICFAFVGTAAMFPWWAGNPGSGSGADASPLPYDWWCFYDSWSG